MVFTDKFKLITELSGMIFPVLFANAAKLCWENLHAFVQHCGSAMLRRTRHLIARAIS
jgi:hypothetical protein